MRRWTSVIRTPLGVTAAALTAALLVLAVIAPILWSDDADAIDTDHLLAGPSAQHWAGTDNLGRDIFYRVLVATRLSVALALSATAIAVVLGLLLGTAAVFVGRRTARLVSAAINLAVAFPALLLALFFAIIFGVGARGAVLAIGLAGVPAYARLTQNLVAGVLSRNYVAAARISGVGRFRILTRHILPNIAEPLIINATIGAGSVLLGFAGLSFLGLGVQPPGYDWGRLLYDGIASIYVNPAAALAPGIAVLLAGLAFNLLGESAAKALGVGEVVGSVTLPTTRRQHHRAVAAEVDEQDSDRIDNSVLDVRDLHVTFPGPLGPIEPVRGVTFSIRSGEAVGLVGESGSGKSLTALAISRLVAEPGRVDAAALQFLGTDLQAAESAAQRHLLGTSMAMVFQDPATSFNPTRRVGGQLAEVSRHHQGMGRSEALALAVDRLRAVRIEDPERRAHQYPFEFSGGMLQRAMIGMGLMGSPALVIADEPTTALDVTVQKQVLDLLESIREADNLSLLLISHDVAVVTEVCDRVLVMYAGRIVEELPAAELATTARHPYTRALVAAVPDMDTDLRQPLAVIPGRPVDPAQVPPGCAYAARCPLASAQCRTDAPPLDTDDAGRRVACWHAGEPFDLITTDLIIDTLDSSEDAVAARPVETT